MLLPCDACINLTPWFRWSLFIFFIGDGPNQADCPQVYRPKGAPQAARRPEDRPQVRPHRLRCQKTPPLQTRNRCPQRDPKIPEECKWPLMRPPSGGPFLAVWCLFRPTCSSASCPSSDWSARSPPSSNRKFASRVRLCWRSKRQQRPTWCRSSRTPTSAPSMPSEWPSWARTSSWPRGSGATASEWFLIR